MSGLNCFLLAIFLCNLLVLCSAEDNRSALDDRKNGAEFVGRMIEEGRTLVHHAMKRFMIILPAIFFKLGIAFTLLLLVTIVAINNGFIGFLLLVVGLSSVLARLQEARRPAAAPYIAPLSPYYHHAHILDRSDSTGEKSTAESSIQPTSAYQQYYANRPYSGYGQYYYGSKSA
ncbi:hypothetical protein HUJ04_010974 [Dendroctonus ponderosae]|uniref:Uncharacterized protein n=1 Tax=Dendroctonus ponderosae TaxID=77166 RepID=A0AAR5PYA3_DENPD|nr:hypothetical protein HUJ04_010974 [Dendroctonus ponderosae]